MKTKLLFLILICSSFIANCQTSVPGGTIHGTWTLAGSPYNVQGSIMIPNDSTLIIQPGVTVNFQGHYKLLVLGRLLAIGTITDSIYFSATDTTIGWYGIRFDNTLSTNDTSKVIYCRIQGGKATGTGIDASGGAFMFNHFSKAFVSNCFMQNNSSFNGYRGGCIFCNNSSPAILNNKISYCIGGGIYLDTNSNPKISNNIISNNAGIGIYLKGGNSSLNIFDNTISYNSSNGIYCTGSSAKIINNVITNNNAAHGGPGGIWCDNSPVIISKNIISYNICYNNIYAGGIFSYFSNDTITDNVISNNISGAGGGISLINGSPVISNNIIINNTASGSFGNGGGILCSGGTPQFTNNTIANNSANNGGALYCNSSSTPTFRNCIFYGDSAITSGAEVFLSDEPSDPNFYYCDVEGNTSAFSLNGNFYTGTYQNNIDTNPLFVSPTLGAGTGFNGVTADWSLLDTSSCIDAGGPTGTYPATDIAGNPRVVGSFIDMGAFEFQGNVGIASNDLQNQIIVYPNPFINSATIQFSTLINNVELSVYNIYGQKEIITNRIFSDCISIERGNLSSGLYFYELKRGSTNISNGKLIIAD